MDKLPFRQVHLDFHTSEWMPDVGSEFSEENFRQALIEGHISSITLFSKCHHGWSYHPTKVNKMHPTLKTDLLDRQLEVGEELGIRTQIYISAGVDERKAVEYPRFLSLVDGEGNNLLGTCFHTLCLNNDEYLEMLQNETREVMERYLGRFDGVFFDICWPRPCVCGKCIDDMLKLGLDPTNAEDQKKHQKIVYKKYTSILNKTVAEYDPNMPIFYNCGNVPRDDRNIAFANTKHLELESLPTGGWGYDHFPMSAAYARILGKEFLGMTGKFHKSWGEFGGFKHPNALIYETALSVANGAKCCIGDQLHPLGKFELSTYKMIGKAYSHIEKIEEWCKDVTPVTDVAIFSYVDNTDADTGANRIMLEGKYLYNIIDIIEDFSKYKVIIFPDNVKFDDELTIKTKEFLSKGGKIILSGKSGLNESNEFFCDFGVKYLGENELNHTYLVPNYDIQPNGIAPYLMYKKGQKIETDSSCKILAFMQNSYFNREFRKFCSHGNTPNNPESSLSGAIISKNIAYIVWDIFTEYYQNGALHQKQIVCDIIDELLGGKKTLETNLLSNGVVTLMHQKEQNRYVNHILYAVTKKRGDTEVIEDAIDVTNVKVSLKLDVEPKKVYEVPSMKDISYSYENGVISYTVPTFKLHEVIVIEY